MPTSRRCAALLLGLGSLASFGWGQAGPLEAAPASAAPVPASPVTGTRAPTPAYAPQLRARLLRLMRENAIPGAVVLIRSPGQGDWTEAFGTAVIGRDVPLTLADHFRVGSNTKTMTATVILQLVQEGRLRLEDPVSRLVPGVPNGERITIGQLAEMRSGLYSYTFDRAFNESLDRNPQRVWKPQELLAIAFSHPPNFAPGEKFEYSNTNYVLLGLILERITGMPASEAFRRRIFEPLGLTRTLLPEPAEASIPSPHPHGYSFGTNVSTIDTYALPPAQVAAALAGTLRPHNETDANPSWAWTAGGAISTVGDLATYVRALVGGGLLEPRLQRIRLESIRPTNPADPASAGYGLGIARFGPFMLGHDGQIPGFMTFMGFDPKAGNTVVVATNLATVPATGEGSALVLAKAILEKLYGAGAVAGSNPCPVSIRLMGGVNLVDR